MQTKEQSETFDSQDERCQKAPHGPRGSHRQQEGCNARQGHGRYNAGTIDTPGRRIGQSFDSWQIYGQIQDEHCINAEQDGHEA